MDPRGELGEVNMHDTDIVRMLQRRQRRRCGIIASGDANASSYAYFTYVLIL